MIGVLNLATGGLIAATAAMVWQCVVYPWFCLSLSLVCQRGMAFAHLIPTLAPKAV